MIFPLYYNSLVCLIFRDRPSTQEAHKFFMGNYTKMFSTPQTLNLSLDSTQLRLDVAELLQYILYLLNGLK